MKSDERKLQKLSIKSITIDPDFQPRAKGLNDDHVAEIADAYRNSEGVDPPVVWKLTDGKGLKLSQGFHRLEGATRAGLTHLDCVVMVGTELKCFIDAMTANKSHGLKRSNEDKRRCVAELLKRMPGKSDRGVAEMAGVGDELVASVRKSVAPQVPENGTCPPAKREGKDGKQYPAAKPKPAPAAEVAAEPDPTPVAATPAEQPPTEGDDSLAEAADEPAVVEAGEAPPPSEVADPAAEYVSRLNRLCVAIDKLKADVLALSDSPFGRLFDASHVTSGITGARVLLWLSRPTLPCPASDGHRDGVRCQYCRGTGHISEATANRIANRERVAKIPKPKKRGP